MDFRRTLRLTTTALLLGAGPALCPWHPAMAQLSVANGGGAASTGDAERDAADAAQQADAKAAAKAAAPPPAIPGAVTDEATATSGHASTDMEPTAALFEAVNRGDLTAAKEAVSRGADLNGKNVLGQSPLDMAIDLNRNDITFLLLSMRNSGDDAPAASVASADQAATPATGARSRHVALKSRASRLAARQAGGAPQRYASDGGTPKPDVGFLGFGGS